MKKFMCENFLLDSQTAIHLYHEVAKHQPIVDYHCHLDPQAVAEDKKFNNLTEIWLAGDHYKWRGLRSAGISEELITGDASDFDKFKAWASVVPMMIGNPLYHWTHLELKAVFGIDTILNSDSAESIWNQCNALLALPEYSARGIMKKMNVAMVGTTDDPIDSLKYHAALRDDSTFETVVTPSWRPDKAFKIDAAGFPAYIEELCKVTGGYITNFEELLFALTIRLDHFNSHGCRSADHGIEVVRYAELPENDSPQYAHSYLTGLMERRLKGFQLTEEEASQFSTAVQVWLGKQYHRMDWVMQLHIGAQRNNNTRMFNKLGVDAGFDSIGDAPVAHNLSRLLDAMDVTDQLPKTILYCLNPRDNEVLGTMIGNFQGGGVAGKIQFGSGWWFNDQKDGMERQLAQLSQLGLLSQFVGMLTDSRSFMSYPRHEYFRRILCNMIGGWAENGEIPVDLPLLEKMVRDICKDNAMRYFNL